MKTEIQNTAEPAALREINLIKKVVSGVFGVPVEAIDGPSRAVPLPKMRHIAMALSYKLSGSSLPDVARAFNKENHGAVSYAIEANRDRCTVDKAFRLQFSRIEAQCRKAINQERSKAA